MSAIRDQRGITLVEIMFAVAIIGIGLVALSSAIPMSSYGIHEGTHLSTATFLANQRLEQVRSAAWKDTPAGCVDALGVSASATAAPVGTCGGGTTFPDEATVASPYTEYARAVRVTNCGAGAGCDGTVNADLRRVTVTVTYRPMTGLGLSATGTTKAASVTMYVAKR